MNDDTAPGTTAAERWTMAELLGVIGADVAPDAVAAGRNVPNARTVRFWIAEGLVPPPSGGRGVHARYGPRHAERIGEIRRLQRLGLSLANIGLLLTTASDGAPSNGNPPNGNPPAANPPPRSGAAGAPRPFWAQPPARAGQVVPLGHGVDLVVDRAALGPLDDAAVVVLRRAAGPLLATLALLSREAVDPAAQPSTSRSPLDSADGGDHAERGNP